jgi:formylglycine-generating enzyme required for sulfatase activity
VPDDSIFRLYFVRAFEQREGDLNRDGFITGEELGMYLSGRVASDSRDTQTPRYGKIKNARLNLGDVVFALPRRETQPPTIAPDRCAIAWDSIKATESEQVIENFLTGCKESPQAFAASLRLSDLRARRRPAAPDPAPPALTPIITLPSGVPISALRSAMITTATVDANGRVTRQQAGPIQFYQEDLGGGVKLEMVAVPGGRFQMGSPSGESGRIDSETQHWVRVSDFWIGRYEVTQGQWKAVMGNLPPNMVGLGSEFIGDYLPLVRVSWEEAQEFIRKLNARLSKANYRLPREAEWEFAARAGKTTPFGFGETITPELENYWWGDPYGNAPKKADPGHPVKVGSYAPNPLGLFDMHGNVWEWCEDRYGPYPSAEATDPAGPGSGSLRVFRGGSWAVYAVGCRSANRGGSSPRYSGNDHGFRLLRTYR